MTRISYKITGNTQLIKILSILVIKPFVAIASKKRRERGNNSVQYLMEISLNLKRIRGI